MRRPAVKKRPKQKRAQAALIQRLAGALPAASAEGFARVATWLASIKAVAAGKALKALMRQHPPLGRLLSGIADAAPYLWDLIQADAPRFLRLLDSDPDGALAALLAQTRSTAAMADSTDEVMRVLRRMKAEAALLVALADIGGVWPVALVTSALTDIADTALGAAVYHLLRKAIARKQLAVPDPNNPEAGSGYIILAMGKMGGRELNFSSDIDLMVFFDAATAKLGRDVEPTQFYVRVTRDLAKILQQRTPDGYVFRVDLRLRPDPSSTQIAIATEAVFANAAGERRQTIELEPQRLAGRAGRRTTARPTRP